ncbi:MAG: HlyD family efflux transporter periplasmic adaptor subunit [Caldimonas sp.]
MTNRVARVALFVAAFFATTIAAAHGDEDHSQDKTPSAAAAGTAMPAGTAPQRQSDGSLFVPKAVQHQLGIRTQLAKLEPLAATVELNARVIADPNASGRVQASQPGRIEPPAGGLPTLGQKVAKGQLLAWLRPTAGSIERANQQAQLAELDAQAVLAASRLARVEQLEGALPRKEIDAARVERDALDKRRNAVRASVADAEALRAPVAGVISVAQAAAGQVVEARETLFEIVDPSRLAVEALAYDPALPQGITSATAALPGGGEVGLRFVGAGRQLREQALPLLFRVTTTDAALAVGQPLAVTVQTARKIEGVALPRAALTRNSAGDWVVWLHASAESFTPHKVVFEPLNATRIAVITGVHSGDRVVTVGASLLGQVR